MPWHATTFETEGTHGSILGHYIVCGRSFHVKYLLPFMACMSLSISFHDNPPIISLSLSLLSKFFKLPRLCSHTGERAYWLFGGLIGFVKHAHLASVLLVSAISVHLCITVEILLKSFLFC